MHFLSSLPILGALATLSNASPAAEPFDLDSLVDAGSFTLNQEAANTFYRNAALDLMRTHLKYRGNVSESIKLAAAKSSGSVQTFPENLDQAYLTPTFIGTPPKKFMLDIDTGSSDLWMFSNNLPQRQQKGHSVYIPARSKTSKRLAGSTWRITYGDGSHSSGTVYRDTVSLAGISVTGQAVEPASQISSQFASDKKMDGIFGFGFSNINNIKPQSQNTWFANVGPRLKQNVLGVNLKSGKPGSFDVGHINSKYAGALQYTSITRVNGFWQLRPSGYYVGNTRHNKPFRIAIADTGTSLAYIPFSATKAYYRQVRTAAFSRQQGLWAFFCDDTLPDFSIIISGSKRTIPADFVRYQVAGTQGGRKVCIGGIQPTPQPPLSILGDVFLKSQYVVFDQGANRIGFANK